MSGPLPAPVVDATRQPAAAVDRACEHLRAGRVVAVATDTVYGLAARVSDEVTINRIYDLKGRPLERSMAVLVADVDQASTLVDMTPAACALADAFWPGPLTIVAVRRSGAPTSVGTAETIGVRSPAYPPVREIASRVGPVAATSANVHGENPPSTAAEVARLFPAVALVVDGGALEGGASTVVSVVDDRISLLRAGPIAESQLRAALEPGIR